MQLPRHIFREYDIRGVAERDLSSELVERIGAAYAATLREELAGRAPLVALSRDGRLSSPRIHAALVRGLRHVGAEVVDIGIGPTPQLYFAAFSLGTDGAIQITGSHNPGPDNGLKLMRGKASFFGADIQALLERIEKGPEPAAAAPGSYGERDVAVAYIEELRRSTRLPASASSMKVVVDAGNGAAGPLGLRALRALGLDVDPLYCDIDGNFPNHHPDPTLPENLVALRERVLSTGAKLGLAWDGDGDRLGAIDEHGEIVWGDKLMILFSRALLAEHPGATILGEVKCSETLFDDVRARGGRVLYARTGHSLIKSMMKAEGAMLAGEMSGHLFFADRWLGFDDGIYAALRLLEIVAQHQKGLGELLGDVPRTYATPEIRVDVADEHKFEVVAKVRAHFEASHPVLAIDGARIDFGDGAWGLCRASNTQPVLVLRFEAKSEPRLAEIRAEVEAAVQAAGGSLQPSQAH